MPEVARSRGYRGGLGAARQSSGLAPATALMGDVPLVDTAARALAEVGAAGLPRQRAPVATASVSLTR